MLSGKAVLSTLFLCVGTEWKMWITILYNHLGESQRIFFVVLLSLSSSISFIHMEEMIVKSYFKNHICVILAGFMVAQLIFYDNTVKNGIAIFCFSEGCVACLPVGLRWNWTYCRCFYYIGLWSMENKLKKKKD